MGKGRPFGLLTDPGSFWGGGGGGGGEGGRKQFITDPGSFWDRRTKEWGGPRNISKTHLYKYLGNN